MEELKAGFKKDEDALVALQKEIEKKSSAWSEDKRKEKAREFQKKRLSLCEKQEDANMEMKKMQEKNLTPIMKKLEAIVTEVAKAKGYTVVLPRNGVLYFGCIMTDAAVLANHAAGIVVGKVGTASVSREELLATLLQPACP